MAIIGSAEVNIRALTDKLEDDIQRSLSKISDNIEIKVDADTSAADAKINASLENINDNVNIDVDVDLTRAYAKIEEFIDTLESLNLEIVLHVDTDQAQAHIDQFVQDNNGSSIGFNANPFTSYASARFKWLSRPRIVEFVAKVNEAAFAQTAATLASLSGGTYVVDRLESINKYLLDIGSHVPRLSLTTTAIFGISGAVLALTSNVLVLAGSLASIVPAGLALPGILAGFAVGLGATYVVLKDFKTAMADLGPQFTALQDEMSANFYGGYFEEQFRKMVDSLFPQFRESLLQTTEELEIFFGVWASAITKFVTPDILKYMMDNLNESIRVGAQAMYPLTEAFTILGQIGSDYLPRLAQWFADISNQFRNFIVEAEASGALQEWIDNGIEALKDLGRIVRESGEIFYDLYTAAEAAGGANLDTLANALERIAEITGSPAFQTTLIQVFRGGHAAMDGMLSAIGPLGEAFQKLGPEIEESLGLAGRIIGELGTHLATVISDPIFQQGLTDFFSGIYAGVQALQPAMAPLGAAFGRFGSLIGELAKNLGPVIASAIQALSPAFIQIMNALMPLLPMLSGALINAITALTPGIIVLAQNFAALVPTIVGVAIGVLDLVTSLATQLGPSLPTIIVGFVGILGVMTKVGPVVGGAVGAFNKFRDVKNTIGAVIGVLRNLPSILSSLAIGARLAGVAANVFRGVMVAVNIVMRANPIGIVVTALTLLVGGLILAYNKVGWFKDFVDTAFAAIKTAVQTVVDFWNNTFMPMWNSIGPAVSAAWAGVTGFFTDAVANISAAWNGFWTGLGNIIGTAATTVVTSITSFFAPLVAAWNAIWTTLSTAFTAFWNSLIVFLMPIIIPLQELISSTLNGIKIMWDTVWLGLRIVFEAFWNGVLIIFNGAVTIIQAAINAFLTGVQVLWNMVWTAVSTTFTNVWNTILAFIMPIVTTIQTAITAFVTGVQVVWNAVWSAVGAYLSAVWAGITAAVNNGINTVRTWVSAGVIAIQTIWNNVWNTIRAYVSAVWQGISAVVMGAINNVRNTISGVINTIQALWSGGWNAIRNAASIAVQMILSNIVSFVTGLRDNIANAITSVTSLRDRIVNALAGAGSWLVSVGSDMIAGLIRGIQGAIGGVVQAARDLASSAVNTVKDILKINSPSKVFIEIGDSVNEGLVDGINHSAGTMAAMKSVARSITAVAADTINAADFSAPVVKFRSLGEQIGEGLSDGIKSTVSTVTAATSALTSAAVPGLYPESTSSSQIRVPSRAVNTSSVVPTSAPGVTGYNGSGFGSAAGAPIQLVVNPSQGMDETLIAELAASNLYWNYINR